MHVDREVTEEMGVWMKGVDYITMDREHQHDLIREAILKHAKHYPESLIVIEEYDKLSCDTRAMIRQILHHPEVEHGLLLRDWLQGCVVW